MSTPSSFDAVRSFIGQTRIWNPSNCAPTKVRCYQVTGGAAITESGEGISLSQVWCKYMDRGNEAGVWFSIEKWESMEVAP